MIKYIKGDLLKSDETVIAHGVNCSGGFGGGIAGQIAKMYPNVRDEYLQKYRSEGWYLGEVQHVMIPNKNLVIYNCATQQAYGDPKYGPYVSYKAIGDVFEFLTELTYVNGIAIPKIGAGLAGGDWSKIERIIDIFSDGMEVRVYTLD